MKYVFFLPIVLLCCSTFAQTRVLDSLNLLLKKSDTDTGRINLRNTIATRMLEVNIDSGILYAKEIIINAKALSYVKGQASAHRLLAIGLCRKSDFESAREEIKVSENLFQSLSDSAGLSKVYATYGFMYGMMSKYDSSIYFYKKNIRYTERQSDKTDVNNAYQNLAVSYQMQSDFRQAIFYQNKALRNAEATHNNNSLSYIYLNMGILYENMDDPEKTEELYLKSIECAKLAGVRIVELYAYSNLSAMYAKLKNQTAAYRFAIKSVELGRQLGDSAIIASSLSKAAISLAEQNQFTEAERLNGEAMMIANIAGQPLNKFQTLVGEGYIKKLQKNYTVAIVFYGRGFPFMEKSDLYNPETADAYKNFSQCYEATGSYEKALTYFKKAALITDSVTSRENVRKATELSMNYDFEKKEQAQLVEKQKQDSANTVRQVFLLAFMLVFITLSVVSLIAYRNKQKANALLSKQKNELENALSELKATQAQLIQSEKMASLGELTAGIAHEIQNPLNFVNNFAEVNSELIEEFKSEIVKNNSERDAQTESEILNDIAQNLTRIAFHGRRADSIVKGMLQHSRKNTGQKEPTDLNALCDEFLRLSYHGLRAKDKSFNADFKTSFDETIGKINIVPQNISRVLLNLFNNAFYAVNEKKKNYQSAAESDYKPLVMVTTRRIKSSQTEAAKSPPSGDGGAVEIIVKDNGSGISQAVIDKIFQPFFTTKPTGQGTGLGLSMSYDIITKEHGGTIDVQSEENNFTAFIITIPS